MTRFVGPAIISPRGGTFLRDDMVKLFQDTRQTLVKLHIDDAFSTDPEDLKMFIDAGAKSVILRTADGIKGYEYQEVQRLIESPGGISGYSYADLMHQYPSLDWWLEIGNEPNKTNDNAWSIRWWSLAVIKELKINFLGHIPQAWQEKYPMLQWCLSMPTTIADTEIVTQWKDYAGGNDVGDGGTLDYYDAMGIHLYGDFDVISRNYEWPTIYERLAHNPYCKKLLITEMGINSDTMTNETKAIKYNAFLNSCSTKVHGAAIWCMGKDTGYPTYEMSSYSAWKLIRG